MMDGREAFERLEEGNRRFVAGESKAVVERSGEARRRELASGQEPFAVILACADSRVAPEIVFDQGLGDLFVIRVAGNVVSPEVAGSIEYAVEQLGTRLVVVLGHSSCGAVQATLAVLENPALEISPDLRSLVDRIAPAARSLFGKGEGQEGSALVAAAVEANVRSSVTALAASTPALARRIASDGLLVLGAHYALATGVVDFLEIS